MTRRRAALDEPIEVRFHRETLDELAREAKRQRRSRGWLLRLAWEIARERILKLPTARPL